MSFLSKLFTKEKSEVEPGVQPVAAANPEPVKKESPYLTETVVFGMHAYRRAGDDSSVYFVDETRGIRKMLVDSEGRIQNFPGIIKEAFWVKEVAPNAIRPQIRFRTSFEKREGKWIMLWQIQPDGWYWADEGGFGAEKDLEVTLYTYVDMDGNFTGPFRIYQLGNRGFAMDRFEHRHAQLHASALQAIREGDDRQYWDGSLFPQLLGFHARDIGDMFYHIRNREEAMAYWNHPELSRELVSLSEALLVSDKTPWAMFRKDAARIKGCMTLFYLVSGEAVFQKVLDKFYGGKLDEGTVKAWEKA